MFTIFCHTAHSYCFHIVLLFLTVTLIACVLLCTKMAGIACFSCRKRKPSSFFRVCLQSPWMLSSHTTFFGKFQHFKNILRPKMYSKLWNQNKIFFNSFPFYPAKYSKKVRDFIILLLLSLNCKKYFLKDYKWSQVTKNYIFIFVPQKKVSCNNFIIILKKLQQKIETIQSFGHTRTEI